MRLLCSLKEAMTKNNKKIVFTKRGVDEEQQEEVARVTYLNNIMHSVVSNVEVYIKNQQIYNSN